MIVPITIAVLSAAVVQAQANHGSSPFTYQGCSSIDISCFSQATLVGGQLTPEVCQNACLSRQYAILLPTECRCGDDSNAMKPVAEATCNRPCMGDPSLGTCGGDCPREGPAIANVYIKGTPASQPSQPATAHVTTTLPPTQKTSSQPCSSSEQAQSDAKPEGDLITPAGLPPDLPTTLLTSAVQSNSFTAAAPASTSCTAEGKSDLGPATTQQQPPVTVQQEPPSSSSASEPQLTSYGQEASSSPAEYSSEAPAESTPAPESYSDTPQPQTSTFGPNCTTQAPPAPDYSVGSTGWPHPSDPADPSGQAVPAQVPGSDSTHSIVPPLSTIGGLALIAAMIM